MKQFDKRDRTNLRLGHEALTAIDVARLQRPGKVSRNTWINEAIQEKLTRDGIANDQQKTGKRANG